MAKENSAEITSTVSGYLYCSIICITLIILIVITDRKFSWINGPDNQLIRTDPTFECN
jgi:hypothetical protein